MTVRRLLISDIDNTLKQGNVLWESPPVEGMVQLCEDFARGGKLVKFPNNRVKESAEHVAAVTTHFIYLTNRLGLFTWCVKDPAQWLKFHKFPMEDNVFASSSTTLSAETERTSDAPASTKVNSQVVTRTNFDFKAYVSKDRSHKINSTLSFLQKFVGGNDMNSEQQQASPESVLMLGDSGEGDCYAYTEGARRWLAPTEEERSNAKTLKKLADEKAQAATGTDGGTTDENFAYVDIFGDDPRCVNMTLLIAIRKLEEPHKEKLEECRNKCQEIAGQGKDGHRTVVFISYLDANDLRSQLASL